MSLKGKRLLFADEYLVDRNGAAAYVRAGGSPRGAKQSAHKLLKDPDVIAYIAEAEAERHARAQVDQTWVLEHLKEVALRCLQKAPVMKDGEQDTDDKTRHVWQFDSAGANGALRVLAKHVHIGGPAVNVNIDFESLTEAQLQHLANGGSLASIPR